MGYETQAFIVQRYNCSRANRTEPLSILAMVDLCKCGDGPFDQLRRYYAKNPIVPNKTFALYKFGNTGVTTDIWEKIKRSDLFKDEEELLTEAFYEDCITKDCYDDPIVLIPANEVLKALYLVIIQTKLSEEPYCRFMMLKSLLETIMVDLKDIYVATYGY